LGHPAEADAALAELVARHALTGAFQIAEVYAYLATLTSLSHGSSTRTPNVIQASKQFRRPFCCATCTPIRDGGLSSQNWISLIKQLSTFHPSKNSEGAMAPGALE
jgi:hypothetical protein